MIKMGKLEKPISLIALLFGGITFGTAYYLLFLAHPTWSAVPFGHFISSFRVIILNIGMSQIIVSNIALVACMLLFILSKDLFWLIAIILLLFSLPITIWLLMPINLHFLEAIEPALSKGAEEKLVQWGHYQILRFIADGLAFICMCKPVLWPKHTKD